MSDATHSKLRMIDVAGLGVCLALLGAAYMGVVQPALADRAEQRRQADELRQREQRATELGATLADRRRTLELTEQQVAAQPLELQPADHLNQRLAELTRMAQTCGLSLDRMEPGVAEAGTHYVSVPIVVTGRGAFESMARFLDEMHRRWPDLAVAAIDMTGDPRQSADLPGFSLQMVWFAAPRR